MGGEVMFECKKVCHLPLETVNSTNTWVKENLCRLDPDQITCVTASEQTAGRGRFSRPWLSPKGENLYTSFYFTTPTNFPHVKNLGQVLSLSASALFQDLKIQTQIKWPNDLLLDKKKVGGILCETTPVGNKIGVILGIGINLNMTSELLGKIDQPATSLAQVSGREWNINAFLDRLIGQFLEDLKLLEREGFFPFQKRFNFFLSSKGENITCIDGGTRFEGRCLEVDEEGRLLLMLHNGKIHPVSAGEIL